MRIAQLVLLDVRHRVEIKVDEPAPESERGRARLVGRQARERRAAGALSAVLRWDDQILLCRHEKPGKEYWLLPGGGVDGGESLVDALHRELFEEIGIDEEIPVEGPCRDRRLDRAETLAAARSTSSRSSSPAI